jgi:hypothetical protein
MLGQLTTTLVIPPALSTSLISGLGLFIDLLLASLKKQELQRQKTWSLTVKASGILLTWTTIFVLL